MANIMTKSGSQDNILTYEHICDTTADMANIERRYKTLGSTCIVITGESGGLEVYIADQYGEWKVFESAGSGGGIAEPSLSIHICTQDEVSEGLPNIAVPEENTIYFVASSEEENNLYTEYVYVNNAWEKMGGVTLDLSNYATKSELPTNVSDLTNDAGYLTQHQDISGKVNSADLATVATSGSYNDLSNKPTIPSLSGYATESYVNTAVGNIDLSTKADKNNPVFTGTINMGRNTYSTIGTNSIALGNNITAAGELSYAEGNGSIYDTKTIGNTTYTGSGAYGSYSHAEGDITWAIGYASHAEGGDTQATGGWSHAEGSNTTAFGSGSHVEGVSTTASGGSSHAEGAGTVASGDYSHAEGQGGTYTNNGTTYTSEAQGPADHIEGIQTRTAGSQGGNHAEGCRTAAIGGASHSEGGNTIASGLYSHAEGNLTTASGESAHAEGIGGTFSYKGVSYTSGATGNQSHSEGYQTVASGNDSHAEGSQTQAIAIHSHAEGANTLASGQVSHAEGSETQANGTSSHAEGTSSNAAGSGSHAEGQGTLASGMSSHAEGYGGTYIMDDITYTSAAVGMSDHTEGYQTRTGNGQPGNHAEGYMTVATGGAAHAEGVMTTARGNASHAEGQSSIASNMSSHAEGLSTVAAGRGAHTEGECTIAVGMASHAGGQYNIEDNHNNWNEWTVETEYEVGDKVKVTTTANNETTVTGYICKTAHTSGATFAATNWNTDGHYNFAVIIGNGTAVNARSNAYALDWDGNGYFKGDVYVGANADSSGGNKVATEAYVNARIPTPPSTDGTYTLQVTIADGEATYAWV